MKYKQISYKGSVIFVPQAKYLYVLLKLHLNLVIFSVVVIYQVLCFLKQISLSLFSLSLTLTLSHVQVCELPGLPFGLFRNCLLKWFGHLALFWPFLNVDKNCIFKALFGANLSKFETFYEFLNLNLVIFGMKFGLFTFFRIWPNLGL